MQCIRSTCGISHALRSIKVRVRIAEVHAGTELAMKLEEALKKRYLVNVVTAKKQKAQQDERAKNPEVSAADLLSTARDESMPQEWRNVILGQASREDKRRRRS